MTLYDYNTCVDQHADDVYRFILKNMKDADKAKDIVQDTFEKLWVKAETVRVEKSRSYIFTTAYHTMIDYLRREKRDLDYSATKEIETQAPHVCIDLQDILEEGLGKLPEIQRSVLLLRDYEGYSYREIGEICRLTEPQVKVYIYRARLALKKYIGSLETVI